MFRQPRIGLLPLYLKLYDDTLPELRRQFEPFITSIIEGVEAENVAVVRGDICRLEPECIEALGLFEQQDVDLIVTLHLAYSPSLESAGPLAESKRPVLMLDTTMDLDFGPGVDPGRIMFNHGIHGVQDLACMLLRHEKPFQIVAGHVTESDVIGRAADIARAALAARIFKKCRLVRIGETFKGMGDFAISAAIAREVLGFEVEQASVAELAQEVMQVTEQFIDEEMALDRECFLVEAPEEVHRRSVRIGLGLRQLLEQRDADGFSINFLAFDSPDGPVNTVPFLEASKAMARGLGYAGEGDILTAGLVAALNGGFGWTTFTEIFCPDWKGGSLFLSHMGEINPEVAAAKPHIYEKDFPWTRARNPAVLTCAPAPGPAMLVNLAPGPRDTFGLIVAPVDVLGDATNAALHSSIRGWIRPQTALPEFLEQYSRAGGTHHSALVLGVKAEAVAAFASFAGIECKLI